MSTDPPSTPGGAPLVVEPVYEGAQARLLLVILARGRAAVRVNGCAAPRVALLSVADQIRIDDGVLHVTSYNRPQTDRVGEDGAGGRCPLCSLPFVEGDLAYACSSCSSRLHLESAPRGEREEVLRCASLVRECPSCRNAIELVEAWSYVPDAC